MKKILIINGHPNPDSFNQALAESYYKGATQKNQTVDTLYLNKLSFDPNLRFGYQRRTELEPDLVDAQQKIHQANHIVWVFPVWWYSLPAILKGFLDRVFLPDFAFRHKEGKALPEKLLKGKSARIIVTADTPYWYFKWYMKSPAINQLKKGTLEFCGIKPVKVTYLSSIKGSSETQRKKWIQQVYNLGQKNR